MSALEFLKRWTTSIFDFVQFNRAELLPRYLRPPWTTLWLGQIRWGSRKSGGDRGSRGQYRVGQARPRANVWTYPGASSLGSDACRGLREHPTVKPVAMLKDALLDLTHRGDIVLDPFLGSGSTLIASEKTGRIFRGLELDPLYVDVIIRRYETRPRAKPPLSTKRARTFPFWRREGRWRRLLRSSEALPIEAREGISQVGGASERMVTAWVEIRTDGSNPSRSASYSYNILIVLMF
jgi:hypothetical protein